MTLVYVAEDGPEERTLLRSLLGCLSDLETLLLDDGLALWQAVQQQTPDLIVLDLMLPRLDGLLLTRLLKFQRRFAAIPVICMSSIRDGSLEQRLHEVRADAFIAKPIDPDEFLCLIQRTRSRM